MSNDGSLVALVDLHNDHNVYVYETATGALKMNVKGDTSKIFDICFSAKPGDKIFATAGAKHIKFWYPDQVKSEKGIFGTKGEQTSFACVAYDNNGICYTGAANSMIYVWNEKNLSSTIKLNTTGFICALRFVDGKLYSGGKDGQMLIINTSSLAVEKTISFGGILIRAIDVMGTKAFVGLRDGSIHHVDIGSGSKQSIMEGHSDGEVWGLAIAGDNHVVTSADDNKIKVWNITSRKCEATAEISQEERKAPRGGASSLTTLADSKCARAVAFNPHNGHIAVGCNDGTLQIRAGKDKLTQLVAQNKDSQEWIEAMEFSPDGTKLAVGSHDNKIYIYSTSNYAKLGVCSKHNSFIVSVDWSVDGKFIRSVCGAHELLFFNGETYAQETSGASNTKGTTWASGHAKYGWLVDGIFPSGTDGTHINGVEFSKDNTLIATGDDYGLVNIFRNPCRGGHKPISLRGHSEHVVRVSFAKNDTYLFSVGGYDQTLMQWKRS